MINVFLDSNILYADPLMKNGVNNLLLEKVSRMGGKIFLCEVVYKEVLNNYRRDLRNFNESLEKVSKEIKRKTYLEFKLDLINEDEEVNKIDKDLKKYIDDGKITILPVNESLMPELIDRAISRKKPFTEKKQEFRDCLIWLTYAKYVEDKNLKNCIFITRNTSDFCDKQGKLHVDLLKDTDRFSFYETIQELLEKQGDALSTLETNTEWLSDYKIKEEQFESVKSKIQTDVQEFFSRISNRKVSQLYGGMSIHSIKLKEVEISSINRGSIDVDTGKLTITEFGTIEITTTVDLVDDYCEEVVEVDSVICLKAAYLAKVPLKQVNSVGLQNFEATKEICSIELDVIEIEEIDVEIIADYYAELESDARADMMDTLEDYYSH